MYTCLLQCFATKQNYTEIKEEEEKNAMFTHANVHINI